jgi:hypothetical protein
MKKLEFLNPALFKIKTNINGYLDTENNLVQISGYYANNDWINIGFYIKANNIITTTENNNTITYLVFDLSTKKYSFANSLANVSINKLYFKLYVYNNKFYASVDNIIPTNISSVNASGTSNFAYYSASSEFSNTALYSLSSNVSNLAINSLSANISKTSLYSVSSGFSLSSLYSFSSETSEFANKSLTSYVSLTSLYSLSSGTSNYSISSLTALYSGSAVYSYTANFAKYAFGGSNTTAIDSLFNINYSRIFVDTSFPSNATDYDSFYDINTKKLYLYISGNWQEINWQYLIKSDRLYKEGRLRINNSTGALEIMSSNTTWYEIIPTLGKVFTPISYTGYAYYIAPGQTYNGISSSVAPIIAVNNMLFSGVYSYTYSGEAWFGIFPSGLTISDGYAIHNAQTAATSGRKFVPLINQANGANWANISIHINKNMMRIVGLGQGDAGNYAENTIGFGSFPTNGYYLGTWCYEDTPINVDMVSIRRES